ncbi:MAG TPA: hypothetical protein VEZ90_02375, partial [Blastocatellia bacterium]|nr:hypothetical protein [Blastocatellia bacterium]
MNTTTGSPRRSTAKRFAMRGVLALILCLIASGLAFSDSNSNSSTRPRARRSATRKAASAVSADAQPALGAAQPTMKQMDELTARLQKLEEVVHQQQQELERERSMKAMDLMLNASQERPSGVLGEAPRSEAMRGCEGTPASGPNQSAQSAQSAQYSQKTDAVAAPAGGSAGPGTAAQEDGPLSLRIGRASISPVGFADLTAFYRSTNVGSSIGTNFGSIPFSNTPAGRLSETRLSAQKTQIGLRADVDVAGAHVIGYFDTDFFAAAPGNVAVPGNTFPNRILLAFADVRKGKFEILGGQSWSLLTPGRRGISPFWSDIFISKDVDINFQVGLAAARNGQF